MYKKPELDRHIQRRETFSWLLFKGTTLMVFHDSVLWLVDAKLRGDESLGITP